MFKTPCVILCGGKSSRMGKNKALLPFSTFPSLAKYQHARFLKIFKKVYISAKDKSIFDFDFIEDEKSDIFSPANALHSIIKKLKKPFFVISVDTPFVSKEVFEKLYENSQNGNISVIPCTKGKLHPLCALYSTDIQMPLETMLKKDKHKLQMMIENIPHKIINFKDENIFFNLNNEDEYETAKKLFISYM